MPVMGEHAPDLALGRLSGGRVSLGALWAPGPLLLVFLRQLGCPCARDLLAQLAMVERELGRRAARVSIVLPTEAATARLARIPPAFEVLLDPDGTGYEAYGLGRGSLWQIAGPQVLPGMARAILSGVLPGLPQGDVYRLGGVFIIGPCGRVRYVHRARHAADNPSASRLLAALDGIAAVSERNRPEET
jgi:peroxiredoxin